jgi:transposase
MQVILNKKEKEQLVIKLYQDGKPIREIARQAHLSFGSIGKIIRVINSGDVITAAAAPSRQKLYGCSKTGSAPLTWRSN